MSEPLALLHSSFVSQPPVQALIMLAQRPWPWGWGVTGSCGYALATEIPVMHADSDLDLLVRCPQPASPRSCSGWHSGYRRCLAAPMPK